MTAPRSTIEAMVRLCCVDNPEQRDLRLAEGGEMSRGVIIRLPHFGIAFVLMSLGALAWGQEKCPAEKTYDVEAGALWVVFSPDGGRLAVGGSVPSRTPGSNIRDAVVLILEVATGKEWKRQLIGSGVSLTQNHVHEVRFSPDGKHIAVADDA